MSWQCAECGATNRENMMRCACGFEFAADALQESSAKTPHDEDYVPAEKNNLVESRNLSVNNMKRKKNLLLVVVAVIIYLFAAVSIVQTNRALLLFFAVYCGITMIIAYSLYKKDLKEMISSNLKFKKNFPLRPYGSQIVSFHHVFTFDSNLLNELLLKIKQNIMIKELLPELKEVNFTDIDKELITPESKTFYLSSTKPTLRESTVTLAIHTDNYGQMQGIRWWLLLYGFIDWNKVFNFVVYSPVTLPFWIWSYIKKEHDLINRVRGVSASFYDDIDVLTRIRSIHDIIFNTLVDFLESYNIDTSDLKIQRAQVLNINVSGGQAQFGNVLQGTVNKILKHQGGK